MRRVVAILACSGGLAACAGDSLPTMEMPKPTAPSLTLRMESEPQGAEAKTSTGQACRTPCTVSIPMSGDVSITFALSGYLPQTVPVKLTPPEDPRADSETATSWQFRPNPVYAELEIAPPPPKRQAPAKRPPAKQQVQSSTAQPRAPAAAAQQPRQQAPAPASAAPAGSSTTLPPPSPWPTR
jgi:hypothetical protein